MKEHQDGILYLNAREVELVGREVDTVSIVSSALALHASGKTILPLETYLAWTNDEGEAARSLNMPSYIGGSMNICGTKIINSNAANTNRNMPRASGVTLLFDVTSAQIISIMEGAYISAIRTASVTALATELLQSRQIQDLAIIGAGALAFSHIELLRNRLHDLKNIYLFDLNSSRAQSLAIHFNNVLELQNIKLNICKSAEIAIRQSQLIVALTTTTSGYIHFDWLQQGAILLNISLDDPLPEVVLRVDRIIVDDWNLIKNDDRRLLGRMYRKGLVDIEPAATARMIDAELGEIVIGKKTGRQRENDIILVNPFGLSIEDIAVAAKIFQVARKLGIGQYLER